MERGCSCKFQPREGIAAYGYENTLRVSSVILVTRLADAKSKRRDEEERRSKKKTKGFEEVFQEACEELEQNAGNIYQTVGYTKDARSLTQSVIKHEYK